ncbi:MAG: ArsC family reductase [Candidatus Sedimenticola endophacoides]
MIRIYGIPNCDTMRKARRWLRDHGIDHQFHDFRKQGLEPTLLREWADELGWETLLNRRGMMWRKLPADTRDRIDAGSAFRVMLESPAIIKRPLLDLGTKRVVGFSEAAYRELFPD